MKAAGAEAPVRLHQRRDSTVSHGEKLLKFWHFIQNWNKLEL